MSCHFVNTLDRECGRPSGKADASLCDFHAVLDAFEGQWALDTVTLPPVRSDVAVRVMTSLTRRLVTA